VANSEVNDIDVGLLFYPRVATYFTCIVPLGEWNGNPVYPVVAGVVCEFPGF
jgi:hypothetical protein